MLWTVMLLGQADSGEYHPHLRCMVLRLTRRRQINPPKTISALLRVPLARRRAAFMGPHRLRQHYQGCANYIRRARVRDDVAHPK